MRISVISPVKNESDFIGFCLMSILPYAHEIIYACAKSTDGTDEILDYIKAKYAGERLILLRKPEYDFDVQDMAAYNKSFNDCIAASTGEAVWFCHPDQIVINPKKIKDIQPGPLAWYVNMISFAGDYKTRITKGRASAWKNIHMKKFGLHYFGGYGSVNEDFYHKDITGNAHDFHGMNFHKYPFRVADSGLTVHHYCELKAYKRRFEKMKACLKTLYPRWTDERIVEVATQHPRVTLESTTDAFGKFEFQKSDESAPEVFERYRSEFENVLGRKLVA